MNYFRGHEQSTHESAACANKEGAEHFPIQAKNSVCFCNYYGAKMHNLTVFLFIRRSFVLFYSFFFRESWVLVPARLVLVRRPQPMLVFFQRNLCEVKCTYFVYMRAKHTIVIWSEMHWRKTAGCSIDHNENSINPMDFIRSIIPALHVVLDLLDARSFFRFPLCSTIRVRV